MTKFVQNQHAQFKSTSSKYKDGLVVIRHQLDSDEVDKAVGLMWRVMYAVDMGEEFDAFEDELTPLN